MTRDLELERASDRMAALTAAAGCVIRSSNAALRLGHDPLAESQAVARRVAALGERGAR